MTIEEMHASVLLNVDRDNDFLRENFVPGEIDDFINDAVDEYIDAQKQHLRKYNTDPQSREAQENLRTLIESVHITDDTLFQDPIMLDGGFLLPLDTNIPNYDYYIGGSAEDSSGKIVNMRPVSTNYLTDYERNVYSNLFDRGIPIALDDDDLIGLYPEDRTKQPSSIKVSYLSYPDDVFLDTADQSNNVDLDLPNHTHRDIVDIASQNLIRSLGGSAPPQQQNIDNNNDN